jgi:hypothetical protein
MAEPAAGCGLSSIGGCESADDTCHEELSHSLGRGLVTEHDTGPVVELPCDAAQVSRGVVGALGKYWRSNPFVFSLVPRCQGECGSQKYTSNPVAAAVCSCSAISRPWSQVRPDNGPPTAKCGFNDGDPCPRVARDRSLPSATTHHIARRTGATPR